jgi:HTH-type transcriptional regulator/antitoxin HigA
MDPILAEKEYRQALLEIEALMDTDQKTAENDRLDALVNAVEAYESIHYRIKLPPE